MMWVIKMLFLVCLVSSIAFVQAQNVYTEEILKMDSENLNEEIQLRLHLPETFPFSAETTKYPIAIVFDSQHDRTYPHIINSIDLLTSETQIPEMIIVGVPFNQMNRYYLTSNKKEENDSLSGIQRMEKFIFNELIPRLKSDFKANDFITLSGHSRTAFLVNYLAFHHSDQVNNAIALSGFFDDQLISVKSFHSFLTDETNFKSKFRYYYTAGTTLEESTYLSEYRALNNLLSNDELPLAVNIEFHENANANHMSNYWVSIPRILMSAFSDYNAILDTWLHEKLEQDTLVNALELFKLDIQKAGEQIGENMNPNLTHIFSLASYFVYTNKDYQTAAEFMELGLDYYPDYLDFYVELIGYYSELSDAKKVAHYQAVLKEKVLQSVHLTQEEKKEFIEYIQE